MNIRSLSLAALFLFPSIAWPQDEVKFKAQTDLVLVPVVVRDANGSPIGNLQKQDFQLFDKGKPVTVTKFIVEDTTGQVAEDRNIGNGSHAKPAPAAIPGHFVALLFDDLHMTSGRGNIGDFGDLVYSRDAAQGLVDAMQPADRMAIFTTSGEVTLDFTDDRAMLKAALLKIRAAFPNRDTGSECQIDNGIERQSRTVVRQAENVVRRVALLPGQRTVVLITSGLLQFMAPPAACPWTLVPETTRLISNAVRSHVVVNGLDARGLALQSGFDYQTFQVQLASGTGGRFIADTNDLKGAARKLAETPKYIYVLGFAPESLKPDGSFHSLTVKLTNEQKFDIRARDGYWAPDAREQAHKRDAPPAVETTEQPRVDEAETKVISAEIGIPAAPAAPPSAPSPIAPAGAAEVITRDEPVTFKVQSNLVEVPVIVRDRQGHAVGNLTKDNFRIFDKNKRQEIAKFSVQSGAGAGTVEERGKAPTDKRQTPGSSTAPAAAAVLPSHYVAFVFDDIHFRFEDLPQVRAAVVKYVQSSLQPGDRVALYTTSGRIGVDFTNRPDELSGPLLKIVPSPMGAAVLGSCGTYVSYFQAIQIDQQVGLQPSQSDIPKSLALKVAVEDFGDFNTTLQYVRDAYYSGLQETRATLTALKIVVKRMAQMPGQRSVILVSPGFFVPTDLQATSSELMDLAIRSKVPISTINGRGVWTNPVYDACQKGAEATTIQDKTTFRPLEAEAEADELIALGEGTGGSVNLNNDFAGGVRKAAAKPEYLYVLGFSPQNLKLDGSFHALKVTLNSGEKVTLQARRGYWAPKHAEDPVAVSRQEIENAVFSRDEIHTLPVEMHTKLLPPGAEGTLAVLTSVDLKQIHLRKEEDRNRNDLTIVAAVFDANGNFIEGKQKILQLRLRDETVKSLDQKPPVTIDTNFNMKPGAYLIRLVVRDNEGQDLTAENAGVQIPAMAAER